MIWLSLIIAIFCVSGAHGQSRVSTIDLSRTELSIELRKDLSKAIRRAQASRQASQENLEQAASLAGALYDCQTFCKFVSFVGLPILAVELPESVSLSSMRFIDRDSQAFKALFTSDEIAAATSDMKNKQQGYRRQFSADKSGGGDEEERDPAIYWFSYSFSPIIRQVDFSTSYSLQENFQTHSFVSYRLDSSLTPNLRLKYRNHKFYPSFFLAGDVAELRKSSKNERLTISSQEYEYGLRILSPQFGGYLGLGGFILKHSDVPSEQKIQSYSTEFEARGLSFSGDFRQYKVEFNYALAVSVFDSQSYRVQPFEGSWHRLRISYCREDISFLALRFDSCVGFIESQNRQSARLSQNIDFTGQMVSYDEKFQGIFINFYGGDRLREKLK